MGGSVPPWQAEGALAGKKSLPYGQSKGRTGADIMKEPHQKRTRHGSGRILRLGVLFSLVGLVACASGILSYNGRFARSESIVPLVRGGDHQLQWQTNDIIIEGTYILEGDQLNLAGQVKLQSNLANYTVVDFLRVNAYAVDGDGQILASYPLWQANPGTQPFFIKWSFQRQYTVPEATRSVAFSYQGRMSDGGRGATPGMDDGGISWDFWHTP
jgi:hypothetical protein